MLLQFDICGRLELEGSCSSVLKTVYFKMQKLIVIPGLRDQIE